jgi:hypothetical protein
LDWDDFDLSELNPVAVIVTLGFALVLGWAFFFSPNMESVSRIPFFWRIIGLVISLPVGYIIGARMLE